jgi:hypothetical protein
MESSPLKYLDNDVSQMLCEQVRLSQEGEARRFHGDLYHNGEKTNKVSHDFIARIFTRICSGNAVTHHGCMPFIVQQYYTIASIIKSQDRARCCGAYNSVEYWQEFNNHMNIETGGSGDPVSQMPKYLRWCDDHFWGRSRSKPTDSCPRCVAERSRVLREWMKLAAVNGFTLPELCVRLARPRNISQ